MIVVSGCPRSGTSLMMDLMRTALGEDRILGTKFPREGDLNPEQHEEEPDHMYQIRQYLWEKNKEEIIKDFNESKDMNPNGFWEMLYSVQGCYYRFRDADRLDKLLKEDESNMSVCKIVSQGLINSDPRFIDKIVYMVRHPRAVAKSQERLKRNFPLKEMEDWVIHTPEMFINVTGLAARWLVKNPKPVQLVFFDELMTDPKEIMLDLKEFIGGGDFDKASEKIEPKLNRSKPEDIPNKLWEEAENVYEMLCIEDFEGIVEYLKDPKLQIHRSPDKRRWRCLRTGSITVEDQCNNCVASEKVRYNFRKQAESVGIDWRNEPCLFECGMDMDREQYKTIEQSIKENTWNG